MQISKKKHIVLILPRGEAIRNFILSGTAEILKRDNEITLISVIPTEALRQVLEQNCNQLIEIQDIKPTYQLGILREWIDIVHGRWLWSGAAKLRWKIRDSEAKGLKEKLSRTVKKWTAYPFVSRSGVYFLTNIENKLSQGKQTELTYFKLIKDLNPDHVFNGSHIHSKNALPIVHAAIKLGIPTSTFLFSWDNLTSQGRILPKYNHYIVWNQSIYNDLLKIYHHITAENVSITGTPQFDFHFKTENLWSREEYCDRMGLSPSRPIILYTTGMLNLMPGEEVLVKNLAKIISQIPSKPQLIVRIYPKDTSGRFDKVKTELLDVKFPEIPWEKAHLTPLPEDLVLWSNMLAHCEVGINVASTVTLELAMFDKPIINVGYNPTGINIAPKDYSIYYSWDHYKPIVDTGALDIAWKESEIQRQIETYLSNPDRKKTERKGLLNTFFGDYLDGKSYVRIADTLNKIVNKYDKKA
ncbi:MAG: hypothetical protein SGJ04_00790 [Bacteroidota bacterium]|nr:hypothetical protein [Bacteroidota bacterium]